MSIEMSGKSQRKTVCSTQRSDYRRWVCVTLRYGDTDRQGHINNAVYCTLAESGRVDFLFDGAESAAGNDTAFVIARLSIDYLHEMHYPGIAEIGSKVLSIGNSSFLVGQGIFYNGHCCSTAESVIVLIDKDSGKSRRIEEPLLTRLKELL